MIGSLTGLFSRKGSKEHKPGKEKPVEVLSIAPPKTIQPVMDPAPIPQPGPRHEGEPVPYYPRMGPAVPSVPPTKIVATQDPLIRELRQASALSFDDFDRYVLPAIVRFAEFVHLLPASEYDHHSDLGGLFRHGLEVALNASRRSEGKEFALNEVPSVRKFQIFRWRACALLGGMLHDLGKAVIDVGASDVSGKKIWNPHVQPLWSWVQEHRVEHYTISWREQRRHKEHDAISATALLRIIPDETMRWLGEYRGRMAYDAMLMALTGSNDRNNPLVDIIKGADGDSVATDRAEAQKRLASIGEAGSRSHAAQVVRAMRERLLQGHWKVNELGSLVWYTEQGLYAMYPQCAKEAIEHLREQGITSIPNEPPLILSLLREAGVASPNVLPTGESFDLHRIMVHARDRGGAEIVLDITAIKFLNDRVVPDVLTLPTPVQVDLCDPDGRVLSAAAAPPATAAAAPKPTAPQAATSAPSTPATAEPTAPDAKGKTSTRKMGKNSEPDKPRESAPSPVSPAPVAVAQAQPAHPPRAADDHDDEPMFVPDISDDAMEAINSGLFEPEYGPDGLVVPSPDAPLRDWATERDHRKAVIEDNLEVSRNIFPPTTVEGATTWLERQPRGVYLGHIVEQAKEGRLAWGRDIFLSEDYLHVRYPLAVDECGVESAEVLDMFANEGWLHLDSLRPNRKVVSFSDARNPEFKAMRFSHGITQLFLLLLPKAPAEEPPPVDVGPYITGKRAALFTKLRQSGEQPEITNAIIRGAFYDHLSAHFADRETGLKYAPRDEVRKQLKYFLGRHGRMALAIALKQMSAGETPLVTCIGNFEDFDLVETYDRGFDETLIQRELQII